MLRLLVAGALLLSACAPVSKQVEPKKKYGDSIIVARNMCAQDRTVQHSKDREGQRMYCGLEETTGSHFSQCVCRAEEVQTLERDDAQEYLRKAHLAKQNLKGD
jgi:hypothetical protein